jgi:alpha-beta hydrolase superfamily lysophospholipase
MSHAHFPWRPLGLIAAAVALSAPAFPVTPVPNVVCPRAGDADELHSLRERNPGRNPGLRTGWMDWGPDLRIRVGVQEPSGGAARADVLFLHGYSDRLDNHRTLFERWTREGFRVIAYELPGHGLNSGARNDVNAWSFGQIADMGRAVEGCLAADRPLFVSGWSTGGLITLRRLQGDHGFPRFTRHPRGAVVFAPGVALRKIPGDKLHVTVETLTSDPATQQWLYPPLPSHLITSLKNLLQPIPLLGKHSGFPGQIKSEAKRAWKALLPDDVPTLALIGGDAEDRYADASRVVEWIADQRLRQRQEHGRTALQGVECTGAMHGLDIERPEIAEPVREAAARFFTQLLASPELPAPATLGLSGPCHAI